jgi:hypothetical protein
VLSDQRARRRGSLQTLPGLAQSGQKFDKSIASSALR